MPEVETIAQGLNSTLCGKVITDVLIFYSGCVQGDKKTFQTYLVGRKIQKVWRRAKLVIFDLDLNFHLIFHLKMTGKLLLGRQSLELDKHVHLIFNFTGAQQLQYKDVRKFGYCLVKSSKELQYWSFYTRLGPEPLEIEEKEFISIFQDKKTRIKSVLLDQQRIAGIGNIYADEALYLAGIHPAANCLSLRQEQLKRLYHSLQTVLNQAIESGGSSFRDYVNSLGTPGSFQYKFMVYGRKGEACKHCGAKLENIKVAGRSTVFCPYCQSQKE